MRAQHPGQVVFELLQADPLGCLDVDRRAERVVILDVGDLFRRFVADEQGFVPVQDLQQVLSGFFDDADDLQPVSADLDLLADGVDRTEELIRHRMSDHHLVHAVVVFGGGVVTPLFESHVKQFGTVVGDGHGKDAIDAVGTILQGFGADEHVVVDQAGRSHLFADRFVVAVARVRAPHVFPEVLAGIFVPGHFLDVQHIVAQFFDTAANVIFQRIDGRLYADDAKDADGNAQQRKETAEFVPFQLLKCLGDTFENDLDQHHHSVQSCETSG